MRAEKFIYSAEVDKEYREIDQLVQLYDEFEVDERTGVQLVMQIPVESKSRVGVDAFAFPSGDPTVSNAFPVVSDFAGSDLFRILSASSVAINHLPHAADVAFVEISDGTTPKGIHKESVVFNAAAALYDFVSFEIGSDVGLSVQHQLINELTDSFDAHLREKRFPWWSVLRRWMSENVSPRAEEFNERSDHRVYYSVRVYLPIVCLNSGLYHVRLTDDAQIDGFDETDAFVASIRKHGWPGAMRFHLLERTAEVPVIVTNADHISGVLDTAEDWFRLIRKTLLDNSPSLAGRWAIEAAFFQRVIRNLGQDEMSDGYRSDLDVSRWL
ncbi:MAG: hypothetical protein O3B31_02420 [Chloroflexi bacterium]|nr:hypothetical protein [Chloroflexota bacterium]MDA1002197.1 hypothetical protein [Chloroflexota bacterium]